MYRQLSFEQFCKEEWKRHAQHIIEFTIWVNKYLDELEDGWLAYHDGSF